VAGAPLLPKHGYEEVARLEGYAKGFYLAVMKKAL
jgi:hypothetical protein